MTREWGEGGSDEDEAGAEAWGTTLGDLGGSVESERGERGEREAEEAGLLGEAELWVSLMVDLREVVGILGYCSGWSRAEMQKKPTRWSRWTMPLKSSWGRKEGSRERRFFCMEV